MEAFDTTRIPLRAHHLEAASHSLYHALRAIKAEGDDKETKPMAMGSAAHAIAMNTVQVVAAPMKRDDRSKAWQAFQAEYDGSMIVTQSEYDKAARMADAIRSHKTARTLLEAEGVVLDTPYHYSVAGRACRSSPDIAAPGFLADIKTSDDISPEKLPHHLRRYGIHNAMAWYRSAYFLADKVLRPVYIIACESSSFAVQVYELELEALNEGAEFNEKYFSLICSAEATGAWPAYALEDDILPLGVAKRW